MHFYLIQIFFHEKREFFLPLNSPSPRPMNGWTAERLLGLPAQLIVLQRSHSAAFSPPFALMFCSRQEIRDSGKTIRSVFTSQCSHFLAVFTSNLFFIGRVFALIRIRSWFVIIIRFIFYWQSKPPLFSAEIKQCTLSSDLTRSAEQI